MILVTVFLSVVLMPAFSVERQIRIYPLGDSITLGLGSTGSYRYPLWQRLSSAGYTNVTTVGTLHGSASEMADKRWSAWHDGHRAWTADQILTGNPALPGSGRLSGSNGWASRLVPDIVLVHLGTNDIHQGASVADTIGDLSEIIDALRASNPGIKVILAQIIPATPASGFDPNHQIPAFNANIPSLARSKSTAASPVVVADQYSGFDPNTDLASDGIHPNDRGAAKMASVWYRALVPLLGSAPAQIQDGRTNLGDLRFIAASGIVLKDREGADGWMEHLAFNHYDKGLGASGTSSITYALGGRYARFASDIGIDEVTLGPCTVSFRIYRDGVLAYDSGAISSGGPVRSISIPTGSTQQIRLVTTMLSGNASQCAPDWASARLYPVITAAATREPPGTGLARGGAEAAESRPESRSEEPVHSGCGLGGNFAMVIGLMSAWWARRWRDAPEARVHSSPITN